MKLSQRLILVAVLFSFTVTGQSMYASEASAGAADGQLSLECPRPGNWKLPNGQCVAKGTMKRAGIAVYGASQGKGGKSDSDLYAKAESYCKTNVKLFSLKLRLHDVCYPFVLRLCGEAYIAGATKFVGR
jgi:hypothetical protein